MEEKLIGVVIVLEGKAHTRSLFITCLQIDKSATAYCLIDYFKIWKTYTACGVPSAKGYFVSGSGGEQQRCAPHDKDKRKLN